jgi:hypothetical protein
MLPPQRQMICFFHLSTLGGAYQNARKAFGIRVKWRRGRDSNPRNSVNRLLDFQLCELRFWRSFLVAANRKRCWLAWQRNKSSFRALSRRLNWRHQFRRRDGDESHSDWGRNHTEAIVTSEGQEGRNFYLPDITPVQGKRAPVMINAQFRSRSIETTVPHHSGNSTIYIFPNSPNNTNRPLTGTG